MRNKQPKAKTAHKAERLSRAKYECPKALSVLIRLANRLPAEDDLPDFLEYEDRAAKKLSESQRGNLSQEESWKLAVVEVMTDLGSRAGNLVMFLFQEAFTPVGRLPESSDLDAILTPDVVRAFIGNYINIKSDRDNFIKFARALNEIRKGDREKSQFERFEMMAMPYISEDNKIEIMSNTFFPEVIRGIEADRLRLCEVCDHIFWAKRKDAETCSPNCLNVLRQRRFRQQNKEQVNARRRENYAHKKKLKERKQN
jgi:predicted nucleic acid-binding Zn ribbon protein